MNITKENKTLTIGNKTIKLNQNETPEQAIARFQSAPSDGGGFKGVSAKDKKEALEAEAK